MVLDPSRQDKRHGPTRVEPNVDGSFLSKHPDGDKPVGEAAHAALRATQAADGNSGAGSDPAHGTVRVITGSGFGTKADYNTGGYTISGETHTVARSTDFEGASTQFPVDQTEAGWKAHLDGIFPRALDEAAEYKSTLELSGGPGVSGKWLKRLNDDEVAAYDPTNNRLMNFRLSTETNSHSQMYMSVHMRMQQSYATGKTLRFTWDGGDNTNTNLWVAKNGDALAPHTRAEGSSTGTDILYAENAIHPDDQWHRFEMIVDFTAGEVSMYSQGVPLTQSSKGYEEVLTGWVGAGATFNHFDFGNTVSGITEAGQFLGWALPYLDFSYKRVELTDSPTWGQETKKVVQTPINDGTSGWTDTRIPIVINQGDFADLNGKYLHVVDRNTSIYSEAL